jgi:hypothetical protein
MARGTYKPEVGSKVVATPDRALHIVSVRAKKTEEAHCPASASARRAPRSKGWAGLPHVVRLLKNAGAGALIVAK